jgi:hypothetical protein
MFAGLFTALSIGIIDTSACSNPLLRRAGPEPFTPLPHTFGDGAHRHIAEVVVTTATSKRINIFNGTYSFACR